MIEFKLPSLGSDMEEGKLLQWKVAPGDAVTRGQVVAVVDTSKAAVDVESWQEGRVFETLVEPGETVPVGTVLATFLEAGESPETAPHHARPAVSARVAAPAGGAPEAAPLGSAGAVPAGGAPQPALVVSAGPAPPARGAPQPAPWPGAPPQAAPTAAPSQAAPAPLAPHAAGVPAPPQAVGVSAPPQAVPAAAPAVAEPGVIGRRRISPAARRRAEEIGIDLDTVTGSGAEGAITLQDVERAAVPAPAPAAADKQAEMRRAIGAAMSRSKREIPHYYLSETIPMRTALDWLAQANAQRGIEQRLLVAVLQLKAVALALRQYPDLNGVFADGAFRPSPAVHTGVAISLRQGGLIAPALHDVGDKSLDQLMRELTDLVARTRAGSLRSSEMSDPTVTVTNLGEQGVEAVYGVIYPPQVALVGFGRIAERAWVDNGGMRTMPVVTASLAADHRVSDGHYGALFLAALRERLQHPEQL